MSEFNDAFNLSLPVAEAALGEQFSVGQATPVSFSAISIEAAADSREATPGGLLNNGNISIIVSLDTFTASGVKPESVVSARGGIFRVDQVVDSGLAERTLMCRQAGIRLKF